jgi:protein SCO1/2
MMARFDRTTALGAGAALVALLGVTAWAVMPAGDDRFADCRTTRIMGGSGAIGGPFTLVSETGATVTDAEVITEPTLLYFGYTFCPDVCPLDASRNAAVTDILAEKGVAVQPVVVSVDPDRDTPARLAEWTDYLHPKMLGLTGSVEQLSAATRAYRAYFSVPADRSEPDYVVSHSRMTYLVLPGTGFVELFDGDVAPEAMADQVACFVAHGV